MPDELKIRKQFMQSQIEEAAYNIKYLAMMLKDFTICYDSDNPLEAISCAYTVSSYITQEIKKITDTF